MLNQGRYARWKNFQVAINRAIDSCKTQGLNGSDHFRDLTKMITLGRLPGHTSGHKSTSKKPQKIKDLLKLIKAVLQFLNLFLRQTGAPCDGCQIKT